MALGSSSTAMELARLLREVVPLAVEGPADADVTAVTADSRQVSRGSMFVAISGFTHDGHTFVSDAVAAGAAAVVAERPVPVATGVTRITVADSREALARLSSAFYGHPSRGLSVIGITGTNGKGTTAYLIEAILTRAGRPCGIIGTMGAKVGGTLVVLERTTPEAPELQRWLRRMADAGLRYAAVEVASHALALRRVEGCRFRVAVFTNLTQDHLDFHMTLDDYLAAKRRLFEMVEPDGVAIVNADDPHGAAMAAASRAPVLTFGLGPADVRAEDVRLHIGGAEFVLQTPHGRRPATLRLHGRFNVSNALAAVAVALSQGVPLDATLPALADFPGVPGRFETVSEGQPFAVVVDYAHTPDSLENVIRTGLDFAAGRTIVVFGCGGDRDRTKRPLMGAIAARLADVAIVTSDNPRTEDPDAIIEEIMTGIRAHPPSPQRGAGKGEGVRVEVEPDRRKAINRAIDIARPGDVVIIAGKGHELYQEIHGVKHLFDDREVAREALKARRGPMSDVRGP